MASKLNHKKRSRRNYKKHLEGYQYFLRRGYYYNMTPGLSR